MDDFWGDLATAGGGRRLLVVGHRGVGKNVTAAPPGAGGGAAARPSVKENTVLSFNRAAEDGADFVEFDVQVTKDSVPILFHDDYVYVEGQEARKISDLTEEEFRATGPRRTGDGSLQAGPKLLRRAYGGAVSEWAVGEDDAPCTLAEAFAGADPRLGFNVEVKFFGFQARDVDAAEIARMLDAILPVVARHRGERRVYFSTFHPDAVGELRRRLQSAHPVFFLTDGGGHVFEDPRMNSVPAAIELSRSARLAGIVSEVQALIKEPGLVKQVKDAGLQLLTYGDLNNDADAMAFQRFHGVDGVIVDHVREMAACAKSMAPHNLAPPFGRFGPTPDRS